MTPCCCPRFGYLAASSPGVAALQTEEGLETALESFQRSAGRNLSNE